MKKKKIKHIQQSSPQPLPLEIQNEGKNMVSNGLTEAIMGFNPTDFGANLSQVDTLFKNNRWYLVSNMRQVLSEIYVEHGPIQTIVDIPVDDGLRGGVEIFSKQLSPEDIETLKTEMEKKDDLNTLAQAIKWNRLYGGAGLVIMTEQDPEEPLDLEAIGQGDRVEFRAVDMWELLSDQSSMENYDVKLKEQNFEHYLYYGVKIHKSRVLTMKGLTAPSFIRPRLRGWGISIVEALIRSINQYLKSNNLTYEVLDEFKLDIFKIKGLTGTLLSPDGTNAVQKRIQLANYQKNFQNSITMDAEDDHIQKQLSFGGLAEVMREIRIQIAADMRIPITKLFGISSAGFNNGEDDIENYNAMIEGQVRKKCRFDLLRMIQIRCQQIFGYIPDDIAFTFAPLRILTSEQEETVKDRRFTRVLLARQANEISSLEFRQAVNKDNLLPIQLSTEEADLGVLAKEKEKKDAENKNPQAS